MTTSLSQEFTPKERFLHHIAHLNTSPAPHEQLYEAYTSQLSDPLQFSHPQNINAFVQKHYNEPIFSMKAAEFLDENAREKPAASFLHTLLSIHELFTQHLKSSFPLAKLHYFMRDLYSALKSKLLTLFMLRNNDEIELMNVLKALNESFAVRTELLLFVWRYFVRDVWQMALESINGDMSQLNDLKYLQLEFLVHFNAKVYSMDAWAADSAAQQQRNILLREIMAFLTSESVSLHLYHLLMYKEEYEDWNRAKEEFDFDVLEDLTDEQADEYDLRDTQDLIPQKYRERWNGLGIGCLLHAVFVERLAYSHFVVEDLMQPYYYYQYSSVYVSDLMQSQLAQFALVGQRLAEHFLSQMPLASLHIDESDSYRSLAFHFKFVTALMNFMASCPEHEARSKAYRMLNTFISKFDDHGRMELLKATIKECPFPSLLGLLLSRLKEELCKEYNALLVRIKRDLQSEYQPSQPPSLGPANAYDTEKIIQEAQSKVYVPPIVAMDHDTVEQLHLRRENIVFATKESLSLICDALSKYTAELSLDSVDVLLHGLNTYYFLLLRDRDPNLTGVRDKESLQAWREKVLEPLQQSIEKNLREIEDIRRAEEEQKAKGGSLLDLMQDEESEHDSCSIDLDELDELDLDDEELELTEEEKQLLQEDRSMRVQRRQMQESEVAELGSMQRMQYEMRVVMLSDLLARVRRVMELYSV